MSEPPLDMNINNALAIIRDIAQNDENIFLVNHAKNRGKQRSINRQQIIACIRKGTLIEAPFLNSHCNWQMTLFRHAAGEQMTCVIAVELPKRIIVVTVY